jgi:hypothetical protein
MWSLCRGLSKKVSFRLAVMASDWPLLTGGRCWQVVVRSGLTVFLNMILFHLKPLFYIFYSLKHRKQLRLQDGVIFEYILHFKKSEKTELEFSWQQIDRFFHFERNTCLGKSTWFLSFLFYITNLQKICFISSNLNIP